MLIDQFVAQLSAFHGTEPPRLSRGARSALLAYAWPGNVRELRNAIETVCLLRAGLSVRIKDLPEVMQHVGEHAAGAKPSIVIELNESLERIVERVIEAAVAMEDGNRSRAADRLGVSVRTIQRHLGRGPP